MWYSALLLIILTAIVVYDLKKRRKERAEYKKAELLKGKNGADYMKEPVTLTPSGVVSRKIAEAAKREKRVIRTIVIFWSALFLSLLAFVLCGTYSKACSFNQFWKNEFVYGDFVCQMPDDKEFVQIAESGKTRSSFPLRCGACALRKFWTERGATAKIVLRATNWKRCIFPTSSSICERTVFPV